MPEKIKIEEFPHLCPHAVRIAVIVAAAEANALAQRGENVFGISIREGAGFLRGVTHMLAKSSC